MRIVRRQILAVIASVAMLVTGLAAPVGANETMEDGFLTLINEERVAEGLAPLGVYWDLVDDARDHSQLMSDTENLHHNPDLAGVTTGWYSLGENVGYGPDVEILHQAFMDSPGHKANVLGAYNYIGIGVFQEDTRIWATMVFMSGPDGLGDLDPEIVDRVSGTDRFSTAAEVSRATFTSDVTTVYIATGFNFPDALAGGPAAAMNEAPILPVLPDLLPSTIAAELERLAPERIVILGGVSAVSATVAAQLDKYASIEVVRISGSDRNSTAAAISAATFSSGVPVAYIATGTNFPDALAGGPVAAANGGPILLATTDVIPSSTALELLRLKPQRIVILGGESVVSPSVAAELAFYTTGSVERLAGTDRYSTATAISKSTFAKNVPVVYIATGDNFPDALAGGPAAAMAGGPILLVRSDAIPSATAVELARLNPASIVIIGGDTVVNESVRAALAGYVSG